MAILTQLKISQINHGKILLPKATWPISHLKASMAKTTRDNIHIRISNLTTINKIGIINKCLTDQIQDNNISSINGKGSRINNFILNMQTTMGRVNNIKGFSKMLANNTLTLTSRMVLNLFKGQDNLNEESWTVFEVPHQDQIRTL